MLNDVCFFRDSKSLHNSRPLPANMVEEGAVQSSETNEPLKASHRRYSLSFGQKALWFIHQLHPKSAAYNTSIWLKSDHRLDNDILKQAFLSIISEQSALRSFYNIGLDERPF